MESATVGISQTTSSFSVGGVLNRTFSVITQRFALFFSLAAVPMLMAFIVLIVVMSIAMLATLGSDSGMRSFSVMHWIVFLLMFFVFLCSFVMMGAFSYAVLQILAENPVSFMHALSRGLKRFFPLVLTSLVSLVATYIGFFLLVIPGLILICFWIVAIPVCVIEKAGVFQSLRRSFNLTSGYRWKIFALLVIYIVGYMGIYILTNILMIPIMSSASLNITGTAIFGLLQIFVQIISSMFLCSMVAVIYHDLLLAKEGIVSKNLAAVFN